MPPHPAFPGIVVNVVSDRLGVGPRGGIVYEARPYLVANNRREASSLRSSTVLVLL